MAPSGIASVIHQIAIHNAIPAMRVTTGSPGTRSTVPISTSAIALYKALGGGWKNTGRKALLTDETRNAMKQRTNWGKLLPDSQPPNEDTSGAAKAAP